jgi:hypothetical protein
MENIVLLTSERIIKHVSDIRFYIGEDIFDNGSLALTNFRLLWFSTTDLREMFLKDIVKIESMAGFFNMSSPKIVLDLVKIDKKIISSLQDWECKICSTINKGKNDKCSECGVKGIQSSFKDDGKACKICTFINMGRDVCEMCENPLEIIQIKLSFRQGGMQEFLSDLQKYWNQKEWENVRILGVGGVSTVLDRLNEAKIKVFVFL